MDELCIICDHSRLGHYGTGCHRTSFLKGSCDCDFVEQPPLPASATAEQYHARAAWWSRRVAVTADHMRRARYGSDRWRRLDAFRRSAETARERSIEMARALEAAAALVAAPRSGRPAQDDLLDLISIPSLERQPACTLDLLLERFDASTAAERAAVKARVEAEFDELEPRHRRELLEDEDIRGILEHIGVVSAWDVSFTNGPSADEDEDDGIDLADEPAIAHAFDAAMRETAAHVRFQQALDEEYGDTIGDAYWAQTEAEIGRLPRDEAFITEYRDMRARVETFWRHWTLAPSPMIQRALMAQDPDGFKRHMTLAIQVLTPTEKFRFKAHEELFGWIASGMQPLLGADGERVPLDDLIEARYLALITS